MEQSKIIDMLETYQGLGQLGAAAASFLGSLQWAIAGV